MNLDNIFSPGGTKVKNPRYSKRTKNTEPEYITVADYNGPGSVNLDIISRDPKANTSFIVDTNEHEDAVDYGLTITEGNKDNMRALLAESQSNWSKLTNALGQTLVSEIVLGTVKGLSDLVDFVGQAVGLSDHDYSNPVSQFLEEKQKEFEEWAPVYADPNKNITNGGLADFGWWMSNLPSVASSLTLLIPSTGVTKGLSYLGKVSKVSKYTNRAARAVVNPIAHAVGKGGFTKQQMGVFFETGINAALSRTMENYQEARQTYNDTYADMASSLKDMSSEDYNAFLQRNAEYLQESGVDINDRDEVAKQIARSSADRTFQLDFANVVFDAYQIYGLRNLLTHAPRFNTNAATRAAQREAIRTAGMDAEKATAELAKDTKWTKARHWLGDKFIGAGRQIRSELSEGVEEAVNYIAQQEGTHLGKYILTGEDGDSRDLGLFSSLGPMTRRILDDYINDSGLWDSAFWGVMGGVVFQAGGNRLNRISQTIKNRKEAEKSANKDNATTQEAKVTPHWWQLDQLNETERMLGEIKGRNVKLQTLRTNMQAINSGRNPYIKNEDGSNPQVSSPVEERMLREKAYTEYLDELIITARNNGTLNMLESYLEDSNVRSAIVDAYQSGDETNKVSKQEAEEAAAKAAERIKKIDRLYQNEIIHASNIADRIGDREGTELPAEYIQMISSANVRHRLNLERYDEVAALYNEDTERIKEVLGDRFYSSIDYQGLVSLKATIQELSSLEAERKELQAQQDEKPTLTRQFELEELNQQIDVIKRKALSTASDAEFARTLYALNVASSAMRKYAPNGKDFKVVTSDLDLISNIDTMLTKDLSDIFKQVGAERREVSTDAVLGELRKVQNDMRYVLPTATDGQLQDSSLYLDSLDPKLSENYEILSRIEIEKIKENAKLAETEREIRHYVDVINNIENVARKRAIEEAFDVLSGIQRKHMDVNMMRVVNSIYRGPESADFLVDTNGLSDEERGQVREALKVLNVADVKNRSLFDRLSATLIKTMATQSQVDANNAQNTEQEETVTVNPTQSSSTSQSQNVGVQSGSLNNQSGTQSTQATSPVNGQNEQNQSANTPPQVVKLTDLGNGKLGVTESNTNTNDVDIPVRPLGNGLFELSFTDKGKNVSATDISNPQLFDVQQQPMDGAVVTRNPIVKINGNNEVEVVAQGLVQNPQVANTSAQSYIDRMDRSNDSKEVDAIFTEGLNAGIPENQLFGAYSRRQKEIDDAKRANQSNSPTGEQEGTNNPIQPTGNEGAPQTASEKAKPFIERLNAAKTHEEMKAIHDEALPIIGDDNPDFNLAWGTNYNRIEEENRNRTLDAPLTGADPGEYIPKIVGAARQAAIDIKDGNQVTYESYIAGLQAVRDEIGNDEVFERHAKEAWNRQMQRLAKKYPDIVDNIINSFQSSTTEEAPGTKLGYRFRTSFKKEVEKLVKAYLKDVGQKKVNGKYVISLENLLRFCNGEFQNNENAELIYNVLSNYLMSDEAKELYEVVETKDEVQDPAFLDKVKTPIEERIEKSIREENHRINTRDIRDKQVFDELEQGRELSVKREKDRIYFEFDGKRVGYIGVPKVVNGTYSSPYGYFLFRIRPNGKDTYYSRLADVFKSIANATEGDLKEIRDAALVGGISLADNKTWKAIKEEYTINTIDKESGEEYDDVDDNMLQVIRTMAGFAVRYGSADAAIDAWFNNLAQEYIAAYELAQNKDAKVIVDAITDGFLIRAQETVGDVSALPLANDAIGRNYKGKVAIGIGSRKEAGTIETVVKKEGDRVTIPASNSLPGVGYSNTFVVFPLSQGKTAYAQAYPVTARELKRGSEAAKIVGAFANQVTKYLEQIANNPSNDQLFKELQDFLFEALNYKNATTPLFHMDNCEKIGRGDERGTHIGNNPRNGKRRDIRIFCNPGKTHNIQIDSDTYPINKTNMSVIATKVKQFLADNLQFNISANYIASDNNTRNQVTGLATRDKDGKFVIKIADETFTFESYNDFILDNDLVRVNTMPNEHGNNLTRTSSNPNVRYKIVTSSPVERIDRSVQVGVQDISTQANAIVNSQRNDKSEALAKLVFGDKVVSTLTKYGLLPTNLVFNPDFNTGEGRENLNASFNTTTKVTSIGPKFMAMLSNPDEAYRKQAIRKLIHERLHDVIHSNGNEHYVKDIKAIYDAFVSYIDNENFSKPILEKYLKKINYNKSLDEFYNNFKKYKYLSKQNEEERLEEFLVDTLTSVELAEYLNNVTGLSKVNMRERRRDTLLNKIMRLLAKIMGINVKSDSLYAQEFETLRQAMDTTAENTLQFEEETSKQIKEESPIEEESVEEKTDNENKNVFIWLSNKTDEEDNEYASSTTEEIQEQIIRNNEELESIKQKAIVDGTFMKAPNGKPTNLTERQWLQVRTKNFINWFGDWINDHANASKVVDENGEPLIVYHGSPSNFTVFDINKFGTESDIGFRGKGFYFGDKKNASRYAKQNQPIGVFLNIRNDVDSVIKESDLYLADAYRFAFGRKSKEEVLSAMDYMIENADRYDADKEEYQEMKKYLDNILTDELIQEINKADGVIAKFSSGKLDEIVVREPNQIKSATDNNGMFSTDNDDIRYSSTTEEYESVASIADYIWSYPPEDRAEVASEINKGELSIKCK